MEPVIYRSNTPDVVLLDLPRSIQDAQSRAFSIESVAPLKQPYPSTEPKGLKRQKLLKEISPSRLAHSLQIEGEIDVALSHVRSHLDASGKSWCCPRLTRDLSAKTHPLLDVLKGRSVPDARDHDDKLLSCPVILATTDDGNRFRQLPDLMNKVVCNPGPGTLLQVDGSRFFVPSQSTFFWSSIQRQCHNFEQSVGPLTNQATSDLHCLYDLILMDPPWSNRSVRRGRNYATNELQPESPFASAMFIVKRHLGQQGMVAVWITNKEAIEQQVFSSMQSLGLSLQHEWVWAKITANGEPVTDLSGIWRKPYERLLLFGGAKTTTSRKIIVGVPDCHSRKPSLKRLFDEIMRPGYRALELFARSLTTGWWAWGDQVLHFQEINEVNCNR